MAIPDYTDLIADFSTPRLRRLYRLAAAHIGERATASHRANAKIYGRNNVELVADMLRTAHLVALNAKPTGHFYNDGGPGYGVNVPEYKPTVSAGDARDVVVGLISRSA